MKITKRQLRRIIREAVAPNIPDVMGAIGHGKFQQTSYDLGREDSFAGIRPQLPDEDYMMGYNEAQTDAGLPTMQAPSDSGRGKKLDPSKLKGAFAGKYYGSR
jgi:hypothetical protein